MKGTMKGTGNREQGTGRSWPLAHRSHFSVPSSGVSPVPSKGFTLLELLVSMTILSLLVTTVLFGWRIAASAWQKASTRLEHNRTVTETSQLLEEQMASMVAYRVPASLGSLELFFQGEPHTARFLSRYALTGRSSSGLYLIEYQIAEGPRGTPGVTPGGTPGVTRELWVNEFPVRSREELSPLFVKPDPASTVRMQRFLPFERGPNTLVLLTGLKDCRFEYYNPPLGPQPGAWTEHWTDAGANAGPGGGVVPNGELPRGMAIRLAVTGESAELKPVSIVAAIRNVSTEKRLRIPEED